MLFFCYKNENTWYTKRPISTHPVKKVTLARKNARVFNHRYTWIPFFFSDLECYSFLQHYDVLTYVFC